MSNVVCRFCGNDLKYTFADLGLSPLSNEYISKADLNSGQYFYPLVANVCDKCFLVQAMEFRRPEEIFCNYKYFSSFSSGWLEHSKSYVDMVVKRFDLNEKSNVVEIACNDGYLLQYFKSYGIEAYGVEPAYNVAQEAIKKGINVEIDFFNDKLATKLSEKYGESDLIIGNNVLAHVPDIKSFVQGLKLLLKPNGIITLEFPHLLKLMKFNQFDTIYHEHFSYLSLIAVKKIFEYHGLKIIDVDELQTHGGSIRVYVTHDKNHILIGDSVGKTLLKEIEYGLGDIEIYRNFYNNIKKIKYNSLKLLLDLKKSNAKIAAFGAAAKGNTFLNYCGIGKDFIEFVVDSNIHKQGLYLPGTRIPIVDKQHLLDVKPDYIVILPWNISSEIIGEIRQLGNWKYKFITFIPDVKIF